MKPVVCAMLPLNNNHEIIIAGLNVINSDLAIIIIEGLREERNSHDCKATAARQIRKKRLMSR